jgi:hypothetical protein
MLSLHLLFCPPILSPSPPYSTHDTAQHARTAQHNTGHFQPTPPASGPARLPWGALCLGKCTPEPVPTGFTQLSPVAHFPGLPGGSAGRGRPPPHFGISGGAGATRSHCHLLLRVVIEFAAWPPGLTRAGASYLVAPLIVCAGALA